MDVDDLRGFLIAGGDQDGCVRTGASEDRSLGGVAEALGRKSVPHLRIRGCRPQIRPFAGGVRPPAARGRRRAGHHDAVGLRDGKFPAPRGLCLLAGRLVDDQVVEKELVLARHECGRVRLDCRAFRGADRFPEESGFLPGQVVGQSPDSGTVLALDSGVAGDVEDLTLGKHLRSELSHFRRQLKRPRGRHARCPLRRH